MSALFGMGKEKVVNRVIMVPVLEIQPNPQQPRRHFDEGELESLAQSIRENGILQPLTVRRLADNNLELISGERRLRAAKLAEQEAVPCIVMELSERNSAVMSLVENIQRSDLSYFEEAYAIARLMDFYGMTQDEAASRLGKAQSTVANKLRLLKFSQREMENIVLHNLTERHARALLKLPTEELREAAVEKIAAGSLNVEKTELLVESMLTGEKEKESLKKRSVFFKDVRLFVNTINKAIETMQAAGIPADAKKSQKNGYIEYVVRIPTQTNGAPTLGDEVLEEQAVVQVQAAAPVREGQVMEAV